MLRRSSSPRFRSSPPAGFIAPCEPVLVAHPPAGPEWLHEIKHDGYRILARKRGARVLLWTRHGTDYAHKFPRIMAAVRSLPADEALIDGEAVVLRFDGRSDFEALLTRDGARQASYIAFDLLRLNGNDIRLSAIEKRRTALRQLIGGDADGVIFSEAIQAEGALVFAKACEMGLEGIVSKRAGSFYKSGHGPQWKKCKNPGFVRTSRIRKFAE
jgi:bifunctional non-homologous end joining protein LigD